MQQWLRWNCLANDLNSVLFIELIWDVWYWPWKMRIVFFCRFSIHKIYVGFDWWKCVRNIWISPRLGNSNRIYLLQSSSLQHFISKNGSTLLSSQNIGFDGGNILSSSKHLIGIFHSYLKRNCSDVHINYSIICPRNLHFVCYKWLCSCV